MKITLVLWRIFLAFSIVGLLVSQIVEHDRLTLWSNKTWEDRREIERLSNCVNYLYEENAKLRNDSDVQAGTIRKIIIGCQLLTDAVEELGGKKPTPPVREPERT